MGEQSNKHQVAKAFGFRTRSVHAGSRPDPTTGARALPIYQTTSYVFENPESAAAYFNLQEYGNTYSRIMNPTVAAFEERLSNLDGGVGAVAFASGLAAQSATFFTTLDPGDHVVASAALYGGSVTADSVQGFVEQDCIHGALVGGASLKAEDFAQIVRTIAQVKGVS